MLWKKVEITTNDGIVLRRRDARRFVEKNCPDAKIETFDKDRIRVQSPIDGKLSSDPKDVRLVLFLALRGKVKSLKILAGEQTERLDFPVARGPIQNVVNVIPLLLQMYLDVDRDGNVDDVPANHNDWTWNVGGHGAVITVKTREYNAAAPVTERQPIEFRWQPGQVPPNWEATLTADHPNRIRVFRQQTEGAALINLPCNFNTFGAEDAPGIYRLWIEAVDYPATVNEPDWLVQLSFSLSFGGMVRNRQTAVVRIAPWIMVSDLDKTQKVYIVDFGASGKIKNGTIQINNTTVRNEVANACQGGTTLVPVTQGLNGTGRYLRDAMRFGTHVAPAQNQPVITPVVMRSNNAATQVGVPRNGIDRVNDGIGYIIKGVNADSDLQTGGNMMVSPPVAGYPWGRIICGSGAAKGGLGTWETFLNAQRVQRPILLDTDWLSVGHSDEIIAFVPKVTGSGAGGGNFRMLVASPRLGYQLLEQSGIDWNAVQQAHANHGVLYTQHQRNFYRRRFPSGVDMRQDIPNNLNYVGDNGEGRMGFRRFNNDQSPLNFWLDEFLTTDELITQINGAAAPTPANYLAACTQVWNLAQPAIDRLVQNAQINTHLPSMDTIYTELQNEFVQHGINAQTWTTLHSTLRENLIVQAKLAVTLKTINTELNLTAADIIEVPILYTSAVGAKTHVADMVNFVMLNTPAATVDEEAAACTCIVPKPYGPIVNGVDIYENYFLQQLQALGITVSFIDEWYEYHLNDGEIHCGTNQLPDITVAAAQKKWWTKPSPP